MGHASVQSSATDMTMMVGFGGYNRDTAKSGIHYETGTLKLEALLFDDTQESLAQELLDLSKSPNRLGTKY